MTRLSGGALLAAVVSCSGTSGRDPDRPPEAPAAPTAPRDSLALQLGGGVEIWFREGRQAFDSTGAACYERTLEIRDTAGRRRVPLLYTLESPFRLDDTSVGARVYSRCRAGDAYRVSLRTGRPTPLGR